MVSLHTMIVYHPVGLEKNQQDYVAVSDVLLHNAISVYAILKKVIPILKQENFDLKMIHDLKDSPTSQYRNKTIFWNIFDICINFIIWRDVWVALTEAVNFRGNFGYAISGMLSLGSPAGSAAGLAILRNLNCLVLCIGAHITGDI